MSYSETIQRIISVLGISMIVLCFIILAVFTYPVNIISIQEPIEVLNKTVKPGEPVFFQVRYDKFRPFVGTILRELVIIGDDFPTKYILHEREITSDLPVGRDQKLNLSSQVPITAGPGGGHVRVIFSYTLYGMRVINVTAKTEKFKIVKNK